MPFASSLKAAKPLPKRSAPFYRLHTAYPPLPSGSWMLSARR